LSNTIHKIPGLLSIVVPAYNEAAAIAGNVAAVERAASGIADDFEIIVSDDGSTDGTLQAALELARRDGRVKVVETRPNAGKGWALRKGALAAKGDYIGFLDADLDLHAEQFARLYKVMLRENADAVIGSKRHPESQVEYPRLRRVISFAYYALVRALFGLGLTDSQTGIKLFRRDALLSVLPLLVVKRFAFDIELLVNLHRRGFRIAEAPVAMRFTRPLSRITPGEGFATIRDTIAVFYRLNALKFYDRARPVSREFPPASVIIAGGSPNPRLIQCLEACAKLDYPDYEIILVLDAPPDGADKANIERIKSENGFDGAGRRFEVRVSATRSPSIKRDEAASASRGRLLAFIDDDAFPPQDWLSAAAANFGDPAVAAVGGPNLCPEEHTPLERCGDAVLGSLLGGGTERRRYIPRPRGYVREFPTCNLVVRKDDFDAVGGFGCKFWPGEDTVLCEKLAEKLGKKIAYDPDVIVYHHRRPLFRAHLAQIRRYAMHRGYFVKRFPRTSRRPAFFLPSLWTLFIALGWVPGIFCAALLVPYAAVVGLYAVAAIFEGALSVGLRWGWAVALGIVLTHFTYGVFFIAGLMSRRMEEER
jgi:glycosyltransferase involved in cell wall biosynthesis